MADGHLCFPDGLSDGHAAGHRGWRRPAVLAPLLVSGALMTLAMSLLLAGDRSAPRTADSSERSKPSDAPSAV